MKLWIVLLVLAVLGGCGPTPEEIDARCSDEERQTVAAFVLGCVDRSWLDAVWECERVGFNLICTGPEGADDD